MIYHETTVIVLIKYITLLSLSFHTYGSNRVKRGYCSTRTLGIPNGDYSLRASNSVAKFRCTFGFQLYGMEQIVCFGSTWSSDPPMCISNTCQKLEATTTLRIAEEFSGAILIFSCATMHKLEGSTKLICDGTNWSDQAPTCKPWEPPMACDFESSDLCGWSHSDKDDLDWRWNTGPTSTSRTGPKHDHTLGDGGKGHYLYFEVSSPTRIGHKAVLLSPLYPAAYSRHACFTFWYHILGVDDIGDLEIFFKPESMDLSKLTRALHVHEDGGDIWYNETIPVIQQLEPFQVAVVATRGYSYRSDFAIDDVNLTNCSGALTAPTQSTIQTTPIVVTTTETPTRAVTQQDTTVSPSPKTTNITSIRVSTTKTEIATQTSTQQDTTVSPSPKTTNITSIRVSTTKTTKSVLTTPTEQVSTSSRVTVFNSTSTRNTQSNIQTVTSKESTYSKNTIKPVINPNVPVPGSKVAITESRDATSAIVYILIGVGLFAAVTSVIVAGMYCYRRQGRRRRGKECLSASNPVYRVMAGDEAAIQFAEDDNENEYSY